jgi:2'-5' RNA ligase
MTGQRIFLAVETPADIRQAMAGLTDRLRGAGAEVRWEPPAKLHATIRFFGETPDRLLAPLVTALDLAAGTAAPFPVIYRGVGGFPTLRNPRVIWIGMEDPSGTLRPLQQRIESSARELGFEPEEKEFHPHVTLGRVRGGRNLHGLLARVESVTFEAGPARISEILLMKSVLQPSGSVYTALKRIPLIGNSHF